MKISASIYSDKRRGLKEVIDDLVTCEFFIGLGSGLSWLAWACELPIVLISGFSDKINETVCYDYLTNLVSDFCLKNEFKLIENLCYQIFNLLKANLDKGFYIEVKVTKISPPLKFPTSGVSYKICS